MILAPAVGFHWTSQTGWTWVLLGYAWAASVLPVWSLLQPRDFLNSLLLYLGLGLTYAGIFVLRPAIVAPMVDPAPAGAPPMFPFVFIIIACGAASGFHSLVSSGTTAKQLDRETDARPIGYGGMMGESLLGLAAVMACTYVPRLANLTRPVSITSIRRLDASARPPLWPCSDEKSPVADHTLTGEAPGDEFGRAVAGAGDVNGDGFSDIVIGVTGSKAYVYFGGPAPDSVPDLVLAGNPAFGWAVSSAGDVNTDGYSDIIVGEWGEGFGSAYVFYGGAAMDTTRDWIPGDPKT